MRNDSRGFSTSGRGHAGMFGPTTGDRVRLADTELVLEVERDLTISGDEVKFGGGKVIRDGMGQDPRATRASGAPDLVISNALIVDHSGIFKADIGVRDGLICGLGKAGNPGLQGRCRPRPGDRARHRGDRRRGDDLHCGGHRQPHPLHLPAVGDHGHYQRRDHAARWRHRTGHRHAGHHLHAGGVEHRAHAGSCRGLPGEPGLVRQGQQRVAGAAARAGSGGRLRTQAARRLGHYPGRHRLLPGGGG